MSSVEKWSDDKKEERANRDARWVQPPLPRSEELFNMQGQRKNFAEMPVRPPLPLEKLMNPTDKKEDDEEEDEDEEKEEQSVQAEAGEQAESDESVADEGETGAHDVGAAEPAAAEEAAIEEHEEQATVAVESQAAESESESEEEEVFETIAGSAPAPEATSDAPKVPDVPHVDQDKPSIPLTPEENRVFSEMAAELEPHLDSSAPDDYKSEFDEIVQREMSPNFVEATSGDTLGAANGRREPPMPYPAAGSWFGPATGQSVPFEAGAYTASGPAMAPDRLAGDSGPSGNFAARSEAGRAAGLAAETAANVNRLVGNTLMQVALWGYLAHLRRERQLGRELKEQRKELSQLQDRQRQTNERLSSFYQKQTEQATQTESDQEIFDQNGNKIVLQPGWRLERGTAGYLTVVDAHGRPVIEAVNYGNAYKQDRRREQLGDDLFDALQSGGSAGAAQQDDSGPAPPAQPVTGSGQDTPTSNPQPLLDTPVQADLNHRLPAPHKPLRGAALNPWLWTAVAVLIIIYFIASLA